MNDLIATLSQPPVGRVSRCAVGDWLTTLDPEARTAVEVALHDQRWPTPALKDALSQHRLLVGITCFRSHRKGRCACA